jgi:4-amino-4-deoxy-L-arabinose transferase-like glycosyltransferase
VTPEPAATDPNGSGRRAGAAFLRRHAVLWAVLAAHLAWWSTINGFLSPHPDTIDHWVQSRIFSWGYYEHPPMVAWLLRAFTVLLGSSEASLEWSAQTINLTILALAYAVTCDTFGALAASLTLLFLEATLYFSAGSTMFQIDQPLMLFWLAALWALLRYQRSRRGAWLLAAGLAAGLGGLSKYTMALFYLGLGVYLAVVPSARREWRNLWQYLGGLAALLVVSPVLFWNAEHGWVSFRHQIAKAAPVDGGFLGQTSLMFTLGYLLAFSLPAIVWGCSILPSVARKQGLKDSPFTLILLVSAAPLAFFTLILLRGHFGDPKWANVSFLGLYMLLGHAAADLWRAGQRRRVIRALAVAHAVNFASIALILAHVFRPFLPIPPEKDPTRQLIGWRETVQEAEQLITERGIPLPRYVVSTFYPLTSQFALYLSNQPLPHSVERPRRNLWSPLEQLNESNTVMVCERQCPRRVAEVQCRTGLELEFLGSAGAPVWGEIRHGADLYRVSRRIPGWKPRELRPETETGTSWGPLWAPGCSRPMPPL